MRGYDPALSVWSKSQNRQPPAHSGDHRTLRIRGTGDNIRVTTKPQRVKKGAKP